MDDTDLTRCGLQKPAPEPERIQHDLTLLGVGFEGAPGQLDLNPRHLAGMPADTVAAAKRIVDCHRTFQLLSEALPQRLDPFGRAGAFGIAEADPGPFCSGIGPYRWPLNGHRMAVHTD